MEREILEAIEEAGAGRYVRLSDALHWYGCPLAWVDDYSGLLIGCAGCNGVKHTFKEDLRMRKRYEELPDRPLVGEEYMNGNSRYKVLKLAGDCSTAIVQRPLDSWTCVAHNPALYLVDGKMQLLWDYSTGGRFDHDFNPQDPY